MSPPDSHDEVEVCTEKHLPLVCTAESLRYGCMYSFSMKQKLISILLVTARNQSKKLKRSSSEEKVIKVKEQSLGNMETLLTLHQPILAD